MCCLHDAEEVAAPEHLYLFLGVAMAQEVACEVAEFAGAGAAEYAAAAVEVGADAYVLYAHDADHVVEVLNGMVDGGCGGGGDEESLVECDLRHAACLGECAQLLVGEVARMVAQGAG